MRDVDGGDAQAALELLDDGAHLHAQLGVQVGERLVHQQHARLDDERTRQRNALLLAAGELAGLAGGQRRNLHQLQRLLHAAVDLLLVHLARLEAVGHVLLDGQVRKDRVILEHHADVALVRGHIVDAVFAKVEIAALDGVKAGDHAQQRGLAAAGRSQQGEELALFNVQGHTVQRGKIAVALDSIFDDDFVAHFSTSLHRAAAPPESPASCRQHRPYQKKGDTECPPISRNTDYSSASMVRSFHFSTISALFLAAYAKS